MSDRDTDVELAGPPGGDLVPTEAGGVAAAAVVDRLPATAGVHAHPGPRQYVIIAVVLSVLTAFEISASYLDGDVNSNLLIAVLGVMAAMKFSLVAAWYMHMRMDAPFFRRLFVIGIIGATIVYGIAALTFASTVLRS